LVAQAIPTLMVRVLAASATRLHREDP